MQLSKSDYLLYLKHPAWLWLKKHNKNILPEPDATLQALFASGNRYEAYAEELFPKGITLGWNNFSEYQDLPQRTQKALSDGAATLFQGRFVYEDLTCIIDVLQRVDGNVFDLFEIKASTSAKTSHIPDLAFQVHVLRGAGLSIRRVGVVHVNRDYTRNGPLDIEALSTIEDVTEDVFEELETTPANVKAALKVMQLEAMPDPSPRHVARGAMNDWLEIYHLTKPGLTDDSIYNLAALQPDQAAALEDGGVKRLRDIPSDFDLTKRQTRQVESEKADEPYVDRKAIQGFLNELQYPLYFLDYETFSDVIPAFDGLRPYQQVPFQYSLHIQRAPGAELEHREYLHVENTNPISQLLAQLKRDIGPEGSVIVWYAPFEVGRNNDMADMSPDDAAFLENVNLRVVDLMQPFKDGHYVDKKFAGSTSIKKVLPVLVPDLSYDGLDIGNGSVAQQAWMDVVLRGNHPESREEVFENLRTYCALDTLAMVRIFEALTQKVGRKKRSLLERVFGS